MKANCDCGKFHPPLVNPHAGDRVRIRAHWRLYHRTGTLLRVREGFGNQTVCDVALDANDTGRTELNACLPGELWRD